MLEFKNAYFYISILYALVSSFVFVYELNKQTQTDTNKIISLMNEHEQEVRSVMSL